MSFIFLLIFFHSSTGFTFVEIFGQASIKIRKYSLEQFYDSKGEEIPISVGESLILTDYDSIVRIDPIDHFLISYLGSDKLITRIPAEKYNHFDSSSDFCQLSNVALFLRDRKSYKKNFTKFGQPNIYQTRFGEISISLNDKIFPPEGAFFFLDHMNIHKGEKVIDIGTGSGILGIAAAKSGAEVYATDISDDIINLAEYNSDLNGVRMVTSTGSYFAEFSDKKFDVIIANLPQELVHNDYANSAGDISLTLDVNKKGNEIILNFLDLLPLKMSQNTRAYMGVYTLSAYSETIQKMINNFNARLIGIRVEGTKGFVDKHEDFYTEKNNSGEIHIFKPDKEWKALAYLFELRLKKK